MKFTHRQLARSANSIFSKQTTKTRQLSLWRIAASRNISGTAVRRRELDEHPVADMAKGSKFDLKVPKGTKDCR